MNPGNPKTSQSQILTAAHRYVEAGLSVIPIRADGSKAPATTTWKKFQDHPPSIEEMEKLFAGNVGIAIIYGKVSGNAELLDFEVSDLFEKFKKIIDEMVPGLLDRLSCIRTPRNGRHIPYRCSIIDRSKKLALEPAFDKEGKPTQKTLIETRGEGSYALTLPSPGACHLTGLEYIHLSGPPLTDIPTISPEERQIMIDVCRSFNKCSKKFKENFSNGSPKDPSNRERPGDDLNQRVTWDEVLVPAGWKPIRKDNNVTYWQRPGKEGPGCSATTGFCGDALHVFSSNAHPLEPDTTYSKFVAFAFLEHGGDFHAAASELAKKGFGKKSTSSDESGNNPNEWPEIKPLQRPISPPTPFPMDALGELLGNAAKKMAEVIQAPEAICGQAVLAAAALAVQGYADVVIDGRASPVSEFFLTIGESGERKSAVDNQALWPHRKHQKKLKKECEKAFEIYQNENDVYESAKKEVLKKPKGLDEKKKALAALGNPPLPPLESMLIAEEPTYEGLVKMLAVGQPSVGLFSDEGGRFIGGHGMNNDNLLKTAAGLSGLWDGKPISRVRAGDGNSLLYGRRFSFHLMAQPNVSQLMLSNALLLEQGLLSRCLVTWPNSTAGTRKYKEVDLSALQEMKRYWAHLLEILETPLPLEEEKQNELRPRLLPLSPEAKKLWVSFHDNVEERLGEGGQLAPIRGLANKAPEHAVRLASTLALVDNLNCNSIGLDHIKSGIVLVTHYLNEALRLFNAGIADPDLVLAEKLLRWLKERGKPTITLIEIYQYGLNSIRNAQLARKLMKILVEHGWAMPIKEGSTFEEILRKEAWRIRL